MDIVSTMIPALTYLAAMAAFTIAFLVDWIRSFEQIRNYWRHAVVAGAILIVLNGLMIASAPGGWSFPRIIGFMSLPLLFVRTVGFAMLGMHYCAGIGRANFRLLTRNPVTGEATTVEAPSPIMDDTSLQMAAPASDPSTSPAETPLEPAPPADVPVLHVDAPILQVDPPMPQDPSPALEIEIPVLQAGVPAGQDVVSGPPAAANLRDYARDILIVVAGSIVYSAVLFLLARPHIAETLQRVFPMGEDTDTGTYTPFTLLLVLAFAFGEEITFRLGIQNFLAKYLKWQGNRYWAAIAMTSLLWTIGHAGVLDPGWVKFAQIYPVGLMLGWLFGRHGVEACILAHGLFNVIMVGLSSILLT